MRSYPSFRGGIRPGVTGYSLIEIIVVLTIIGILAGLLLPVLQPVRERAREVTCLSNLKQIGQAFLMYRQDHDEGFPEVVGYLWPYTKNWDIFRCPSDPENYLNLSEYGPPKVARLSYGYHLSGYYHRQMSSDPEEQKHAAGLTADLQRRGEAFPAFWCFSSYRRHSTPGREVYILNRISGEAELLVNPPVWRSRDL